MKLEDILPPHMERVLEERTELLAKIKDVDDYAATTFFTDLDQREKDLVINQRRVMSDLADILGTRVRSVILKALLPDVPMSPIAMNPCLQTVRV